MRVSKKTVYAIGLGLSILGLLSACSELKKDGKTPRPVIYVGVTDVTGGSSVRTTSYVGTVFPGKSVVLTSPYQGTLSGLHVEQGDYVEQGCLVAEIYAQSVNSAQQIAQATLAQAEDGYRRVVQVHSSGGIADVKMIEVETQLDKARAAARAADQAAEDGKVRAPFAGVIGEVFSNQGVELAPLAPIVRIVDISSLEIRFPVPEKEIGRVEIGDSAWLVVPALSESAVRAVVSSKGVVASALSHSYECVLLPASPVSGLMPGMVSKVYMDKNTGEGVEIPASVVQMDESGKYVWIVRNGIVEKRYIRVAGLSGTGVVVESGLRPGDQVITKGARKVSTGMTVKTTER